MFGDQPLDNQPRRELKSLAQFAKEAGRQPGEGKVPKCPACGKRLFYVTSTWHLADGTIRRLRKCSACGHAMNSTEVFDE
jgi:DNA-directed RNA polymerase subunit M/transcription elongation factor TFIIS